MIHDKNAELKNLRRREQAQAEEANRIAAENANRIKIMNDELKILRMREMEQ